MVHTYYRIPYQINPIANGHHTSYNSTATTPPTIPIPTSSQSFQSSSMSSFISDTSALEPGPTINVRLEQLESSVLADTTQPSTISFLDALEIPHAMGYAVAFGFIKFVNYTL